MSNSGARGPGFEPHGCRVVFLQARHFKLSKVLVNIQGAVAPSQMTEKLLTGTLKQKINQPIFSIMLFVFGGFSVIMSCICEVKPCLDKSAVKMEDQVEISELTVCQVFRKGF